MPCHVMPCYAIGIAARSPTLLANAWHHRSDALSSVLAFGGIIGSAYA